MADIRYYDVILKPVISEKSMDGMADKKYTFLVHPDSNKTMIKEAVEKMFPGTKEEGQYPERAGQDQETRHERRQDGEDQEGYHLAD